MRATKITENSSAVYEYYSQLTEGAFVLRFIGILC